MTTSDIFDSATEEDIDARTIFEGDGESAPKETYSFDESTAKPNKDAARTSGITILSSVWFGVGALLVNKQIDPPVGRVVQLEAPLAAQAVDDVIAYTWMDKLLQPLFRKGEQLEGLGAVIALPVMVGLYERKPALALMLEEPMKQALEDILLQAAPLMRKRKSKVRRDAKAFADVNEAFNIPPRVDAADYIMKGWIFQDGAGEQPIE